MTYQDTYKQFLEKHEKARDRKYKNLATATLIKDKFIDLKEVPLKRLEDIVVEILGLDRAWRLIMSQHKEWQTESYKDKEVLEQETQHELGYEAGFRGSVKQLKALVDNPHN